ncbi:MAG: hypothetical protein IPM12_05565 [Flavobacteriales bacterium]|nr:hypothetical protein [Flavobacteriales bacterium]
MAELLQWGQLELVAGAEGPVLGQRSELVFFGMEQLPWRGAGPGLQLNVCSTPIPTVHMRLESVQ